MARLPKPNADDGQWGDILNQFLSVSHAGDGTLSDGVVSEAKLDTAVRAKLNAGGGSLADGSVTTAKLADGAVTDAKVTSLSQAKVTGLSTALSAKADASAVYTKTQSDAALAALKLDDLADVSSAGATDGQVLLYTAGVWGPATNSAGGGTVADATTGAKGIVRLAGDLAGTADAPTVPGLAGKAVKTTTITGANSITGGGDLSANRTVSLVGDAATPGNSKYYGTNGTGTKGYYDLPTGSASIADGSVTTVKLADGAVTDAKVATGIAQSKISGLAASFTAKADDSAVVHTTGTETIAGVKTFSNSPVVPTPTTGTQAANKSYVDSAVAGVGGGGGGSSLTVVAKSADYTAVSGNYVIGNAASAGFTVTLPTATSGATVSVKKVDASVNAILVMSAGGTPLIDDQVSISVNQQWLSYDFLSDGTKWYRV